MGVLVHCHGVGGAASVPAHSESVEQFTESDDREYRMTLQRSRRRGATVGLSGRE